MHRPEYTEYKYTATLYTSTKKTESKCNTKRIHWLQIQCFGLYYTLLAPNHLTWFLANTFVKKYESVQGAFKNHYIVICNTLYFTMLVKSSLLYFATNCFMCAIVFLFLLCVCVFLVLCQPPRVGADHHWCRWHLPRHPSNLRRPHIQDMPLIQHLPDRTMFVKVSIINRPNIQTVRSVDEIRI